MLPYIVRHSEEGQSSLITQIDLKLPYMAIVEQQIEQEELLRAEQTNRVLPVADQVRGNRAAVHPATGDFRDNISLIKKKAAQSQKFVSLKQKKRGSSRSPDSSQQSQRQPRHAATNAEDVVE